MTEQAHSPVRILLIEDQNGSVRALISDEPLTDRAPTLKGGMEMMRRPYNLIIIAWPTELSDDQTAEALSQRASFIRETRAEHGFGGWIIVFAPVQDADRSLNIEPGVPTVVAHNIQEIKSLIHQILGQLLRLPIARTDNNLSAQA